MNSQLVHTLLFLLLIITMVHTIQAVTGKNGNTASNNQEVSPANPSQVQANFKMPNNTAIEEPTLASAVYSGICQNIDLPTAENKTAYFIITTNTPYFLAENSGAVFSWLLITTGFLTFFLLFFFLKRRPKKNTLPQDSLKYAA